MEKVGVLYGGEGYEREVSLRSGEEVMKGLRAAGFEVVPFPLDKPEDLIYSPVLGEPDIFFIALHGSWGENGQIQSMLDLMHIPYSGPGFEACALSMDKWASKNLFRSVGVPVPDGLLLSSDPRTGEIEPAALESYSGWEKIVVKPNSCGSTVGVSIVDSAEQVADAVKFAAGFADRVLLERYIPGRELAVTVVERKGYIEVLPIVDIVPVEGFYTYDAKYGTGKSRYTVPADLTEVELEAVKSAAKGAFRVLGCRVYARADMRLDCHGNPYVLEVNTVPGMTSTSLVPKAARAAGMDFPSFLRFVVEESASLKR